jgi:hypothetical protein
MLWNVAWEGGLTFTNPKVISRSIVLSNLTHLSMMLYTLRAQDVGRIWNLSWSSFLIARLMGFPDLEVDEMVSGSKSESFSAAGS